jgi:hypothetical protein
LIEIAGEPVGFRTALRGKPTRDACRQCRASGPNNYGRCQAGRGHLLSLCYCQVVDAVIGADEDLALYENFVDLSYKLLSDGPNNLLHLVPPFKIEAWLPPRQQIPLSRFASGRLPRFPD